MNNCLFIYYCTKKVNHLHKLSYNRLPYLTSTISKFTYCLNKASSLPSNFAYLKAASLKRAIAGRQKLFITPHMQRKQDKVIGVGVHIIYIIY